MAGDDLEKPHPNPGEDLIADEVASFLRKSREGETPDLTQRDVAEELPEDSEFQRAKKRLAVRHREVLEKIMSDPSAQVTSAEERSRGGPAPVEYRLDSPVPGGRRMFEVKAESSFGGGLTGRYLIIVDARVENTQAAGFVMVKDRYSLKPDGDFVISETVIDEKSGHPKQGPLHSYMPFAKDLSEGTRKMVSKAEKIMSDYTHPPKTSR